MSMSAHGGTIPRAKLPLDRRHTELHFESPDGHTGCVAYPINYDELYNLKGRLLTLVDATFTDAQQRKAHKDLVWQTLRQWMTDIESAASDGAGIGETTLMDVDIARPSGYA